MGTLYLVATPIGNLEDITLRGLRVLREASLIAAEDTRHTKRLLHHYDIHTPCLSYHEHSKTSRIDDILTALAQGDVALVSDAGTPGLSDPGFELVNACIQAGFPVSPIPGACAPVVALVSSGLATSQFMYIGFLPRRAGERRAFLTSLVNVPATLVCFEAPHRVVDALTDMLAILGDRRIVVARELTKLHEEFLRANVSTALQHFTLQRPRGEFTLVIEGARAGIEERKSSVDAAGESPAASCPRELDEELAVERLRELQTQGHSSSAAARTVAKELGVQKSRIYQIWLKLKTES